MNKELKIIEPSFEVLPSDANNGCFLNHDGQLIKFSDAITQLLHQQAQLSYQQGRDDLRLEIEDAKAAKILYNATRLTFKPKSK